MDWAGWIQQLVLENKGWSIAGLASVAVGLLGSKKSRLKLVDRTILLSLKAREMMTGEQKRVINGQITSAMLKRIHTIKYVADREKTEVKEEIWIAAATLNFEFDPHFIEAIAANIKNGRKYCYFFSDSVLPNTPNGFKVEADRFIRELSCAPGMNKKQLNDHLALYQVRKEEVGLLCNITIFDPKLGRKEGYILPIYENAESIESAFQVRVDKKYFQSTVNQMKIWMEQTGQKYQMTNV